LGFGFGVKILDIDSAISLRDSKHRVLSPQLSLSFLQFSLFSLSFYITSFFLKKKLEILPKFKKRKE